MKQLRYYLLMSLPLVAFAKVDEFNELIKGTIEAQQELHQQVRVNLDATRETLNTESQQSQGKGIVQDEDSNAINSPTQKQALRFDKEKSRYRPSKTKQEERLARELGEAELTF